MSIILKQGAITVNQPDGSVSSLDVIVDQSREQAIADIEAKKDEVLASIPDDYSQLSESITETKEDLANTVKGVTPAIAEDITGRTEDGVYYDNANGQRKVYSGLFTGFVPVMQNKRYQVRVYSIADGFADNKLSFWDSTGNVINRSKYEGFTVIDDAKKTISVIAPTGAVEMRYTGNSVNINDGFCYEYANHIVYDWLKIVRDNMDDDTVRDLFCKTVQRQLVVTQHAYVSQNLSIVANIGFDLFAPVTVNTGDVITFYGSNAGAAIARCDENGTPIKKLADGTLGTITLTIDYNGYILFCSATSGTSAYVTPSLYLGVDLDKIRGQIRNLQDGVRYGHNIEKPISFAGKRWAAYGDSITAGAESGHATLEYNGGYVDRVANRVSPEWYYNYGIAGSMICDPDNDNSLTNRLIRTLGVQGDTIDIITIAGGTNDHTYGKPLGAFGDTQTNTFYGCLRTICEYIKRNNSRAKVVFITPINKYYVSGREVDCLDAYRNAISEVALYYGFSVVDGYQLGFPNYLSSPIATALLADKIHPTARGYDVYTNGLLTALL